MKVDLHNMLRMIANSLKYADGTSEGGWAFMLEQLSEHLDVVAKDPARWPDFASLYCLDKGPVAQRKEGAS